MRSLLEEEGLYQDPATLAPWSHTPSPQTERNKFVHKSLSRWYSIAATWVDWEPPSMSTEIAHSTPIFLLAWLHQLQGPSHLHGVPTLQAHSGPCPCTWNTPLLMSNNPLHDHTDLSFQLWLSHPHSTCSTTLLGAQIFRCFLFSQTKSSVFTSFSVSMVYYFSHCLVLTLSGPCLLLLLQHLPNYMETIHWLSGVHPATTVLQGHHLVGRGKNISYNFVAPKLGVITTWPICKCACARIFRKSIWSKNKFNRLCRSSLLGRSVLASTWGQINVPNVSRQAWPLA